jgi:hypothetical protein
MKKQDWITQLNKVISDRQFTPFKWGENDCCLFAADCIKAMTGNDPAKTLRGHYHTERGAHRTLKRYGACTIEATATKLLGEPEPPLTARRGDVALLQEGKRAQLGVVMPSGVYVPGENGLIKKPLTEIKKVWRID